MATVEIFTDKKDKQNQMLPISKTLSDENQLLFIYLPENLEGYEGEEDRHKK